MWLLFPPNIEKMKDRGDVMGLIKALYLFLYSPANPHSAEVVNHAVSALVELRDTRGVEPIIQSTSYRDESYRLVTNKEKAVKLLENFDASAITPCLFTKDAYVRDVAADVLGKIGWQPGNDEVGVAYWIAKQNSDACATIGAPAVEPLIALLGDKDASMRSTAAAALGKIGDARALEPLIPVLKDDNKFVRANAAEALGKLGLQAITPLLAILNDKDSQVRENAAEALDKIGWQPGNDAVGAAYWIAKQNWKECIKVGPPAVEQIITTLKVDDKEMRQEAVWALEAIDDSRRVAPLITALKDTDPEVRTSAAFALGKIGNPSAVKPLLSVLESGGAHRKGSVEVLISLYRSGKLDEANKKYILAHRSEITVPHEDRTSDCGGHTDAASIEFPL